MLIIFFIILVVIICIIWAASFYNNAVIYKEKINNSFRQIDVNLRKRLSIANNVDKIVEKHADLLKNVYGKIADARKRVAEVNTQASSGELNPEKTLQLSGILGTAMHDFFVDMENYPEMNADQDYMEFQHKWYELEQELQETRLVYSGLVRNYNTFIKVFPNFIIAKLLKLEPIKEFEVKEIKFISDEERPTYESDKLIK